MSFIPSAEDGSPVITAGPIEFESSSLAAITIDSDGRYLLALEGGWSTANLHVFSLISGVREIEGSPITVAPGGPATAIAVDPTNSWFYAASSVSGITQYSFDNATGRIRDRIAFTPVYNVSTLRFDRAGRFLIATDLPTIYVYRVDPASGLLALVGKSSLL